MEKSAQQHQSHSTNTHAETSHKRERSTRETVDQAKHRSQSRGWEEDANPPAQGAEGGGTPPPDQEPEIEEISSGGDQHRIIATLNWMLGPSADFPAHLSVDKLLAFRVWAACFPLDRNVPEVRSLAYLDHYDEVAANMVAWVLWAITYVYASGTLPFPNTVTHVDHRLYKTDPLFQYPLTAPFPWEITYNADTRFKAREKWEQLCSWIQYWHEAGMHQDFWLEPRSHCLPYFGGKRWWESRLVLFVIFRLNPVLPVEAPIRLDVIMANTGWDLARAEYKKNNPDLIQKMNRQERETVVPEEHERDVIHTHERTRGEADCKYLDTLTCTTIRHHQEAKKRVILVAEKRGSSWHR